VRGSSAEIALSLGVLGLGLGVAAVTASLPFEGGYSGIGPNFIPAIVAAGTIVIGVWLAFEAFTGGWRNRSEQTEILAARPFLWVSAGLLVHMILIGWAGFVIAGAALFACVARGFGSMRLSRDAFIGFVLALAVYFFFTQVLNVNLPAGWMPFRP
jgi:putative tricarboxylic transport membrane protein